jgi:hypothetical protein
MYAEFKTTEYEFEHGRKPRGFGTWAFLPADGHWHLSAPLDGPVMITDSYSNAKRECAKQHPKVGYWVVLA